MGDTNRLRRACLTVAAAAALAVPAGSMAVHAAEDPTATSPGHTLYGDPSTPDISGLWLGTYTITPGYLPQQPVPAVDTTRWAPWPPPLTPAYQTRADERIALAKAGRAVGDGGAKCLPFGMPFGLTNKGYPDEIVQTPGQVGLWLFGSFPVIIWTDGRPHPKDLKPSYNGHSIGVWDGDTLRVDTVGIVAPTAINSGPGTPHSDKLHIKWSIQKVGPDTLHLHVTLYDEEAFKEPLVTTNIWHRKMGPVWQVLDDVSCFENNRETIDDAGAAGFKTF
jgi:hypothetical protein